MNIKKMLTIQDGMIGHIIDLKEDNKNKIIITLEGKINESNEIVKKKFFIEVAPKLYEKNKLEINDILLINYLEDTNIEEQKILSIHAGLFSLYKYIQTIEKFHIFLTLCTIFLAFILLFFKFNESYYLTDRQFVLSALLALTPSLFLAGVSGLMKSYSQRKIHMVKKYLSHLAPRRI